MLSPKNTKFRKFQKGKTCGIRSNTLNLGFGKFAVKTLESKLQALGVKAKAYKSNAANFADAEAFVNDVLSVFGQIDICVNNAGISKDNLLLRMTEQQWDEVIDINLKSVFNVTKQVIKPMMKAKTGTIINMSSIIGIRGNAILIGSNRLKAAPF